MKSDLQKLAYILDLRCPPESIRVCCKYIYKDVKDVSYETYVYLQIDDCFCQS